MVWIRAMPIVLNDYDVLYMLLVRCTLRLLNVYRAYSPLMRFRRLAHAAVMLSILFMIM